MTDRIVVLGVRYGVSVVADRITPDGDVLIFEEAWDDRSIRTPDGPTPLLRDHNTREPVGMLREYRSTDEGFVLGGQLVGGKSQREHVVELVRGGLRAECSIAFRPSEDDVWTRPTRRDGLARVLRRNVDVAECSLVYQGAIAGSRVLDLTTDDTPAGQVASAPVGLGARTVAALAEARRVVESGKGGERLLARRAEAVQIFDRVDSPVVQQVRDRIAQDEAERAAASAPAPVDPVAAMPDHLLQARDVQLVRVLRAHESAGRVPPAGAAHEAARVDAELRRRGLA